MPARSVLNLGNPSGGQHPFINFIKSMAFPAPEPDKLDANMYPVGALGTAIQCNPCTIPQSYTGHWIIDWEGDIGTGGLQFTGISTTIHSGSSFVVGSSGNTTFKGVNGRVEFSFNTPPASFTFTFLTGSTFASFANLRLYRSDQEANLLAGEIFNPDFISKLNEINPKVIRFLDWSTANGRVLHKYEDWTPDTAIAWFSGYWNPTYWVGTIAGTDTYTCTGGSGHNPSAYVHGEVVQGSISNASTSGTPTLNRDGLGAKTIVWQFGDSAGGMSSGFITTGRHTFHYDSFLDQFIYDSVSRAIPPAVPVSVMVELCNQVGCDLWVPVSLVFSDAAWTSLTQYMRANLDGRFWYDIGNETWNPTFVQNLLAQSFGNRLGFVVASVSNVKSYQGLRNLQVGTLTAAAWSPRSASDLKRVSLFQFFADSSTVTRQLDGIRLRSQDSVTLAASGIFTAGSPGTVKAYDFAVDCTMTFSTTGTLPPELTAGNTYYVVSTLSNGSQCRISATQGGAAINFTNAGTGNVTLNYTNTLYQSRIGIDYYQSPNRPIDFCDVLTYATYYQGAQWHPFDLADAQYLSRDTNSSASTITKTITNITQANPAVVTATNDYANGDRIKITSVSGMTQVNNNYYTVANATSSNFELANTDSTGFTAYSSGGTTSRLRPHPQLFAALDAYLAGDLATSRTLIDNQIRDGEVQGIVTGVTGGVPHAETLNELKNSDGQGGNYYFWEPYRASYGKELAGYEGGLQIQPPSPATLVKMGVGVASYEATFDTTNDTVTLTGKSLIDGEGLVFSTTGALPTGITAGTGYYTVQCSGGVAKLSATRTGSAINLTGTPSGTHTAQHTPYAAAAYNAIDDYKQSALFADLVYDQFQDMLNSDASGSALPAWYYFCYPYNAFSPWSTHGGDATHEGGDLYGTQYQSVDGMVLWNADAAVTISAPYQSAEAGGAGAPFRRRAQYESYDTIVRRQKIREIEELKATILARGAIATRMAEKAREFIPYNDGMSIRAMVADLARAQQELEDEEEMIILALLH